MEPLDALSDLLERVNASPDGVALVPSAEIATWPPSAVEAVKGQRLLVKTRAAASATCPGCERQCTMPVHSISVNESTRSFVVCDKRSDVNRVSLPPGTLEQWRCDMRALSAFIALELELTRSSPSDSRPEVWPIGIGRGRRRTQLLALRRAATLELVAGSVALSLAGAFTFDGNVYGLDRALIEDLVDRSAVADPRYTPSVDRREPRKRETEAQREQWRQQLEEMKKEWPDKPDSWYAQRIARKQVGPKKRSAETIRKALR